MRMRGFSLFLGFEGPLDMRMGHHARHYRRAKWLAQADEQDIARVIRNCGEEPGWLYRLPKAADCSQWERTPAMADPPHHYCRACRARGESRQNTRGGQDPATRTFQALRIHINQELADLGRGLSAAYDLVAGRRAAGGHQLSLA
ncbi:16S rRNA (cytosine(1402)-N(4))-methyltransferase [Cupriavidus basilensis]